MVSSGQVLNAQDANAPLREPGKKEEDREEEIEYSPFYGIEKGLVLQETRVFHDTHLDSRKCQQVITKLLYLFHQGETLTKVEATEVFFAVTKLFQAKDIGLRRMVYLVIKELCPSADDVIIVTSSLMKDMNSKIDTYRSNSIRVLCQITDSMLLSQIERYLKQAVVDKNNMVASAALVSGMHLVAENYDIVKRWSNEIQEAMQSKHPLVQFHALGLMHMLRQNDRLAVNKMVTNLTRGQVRSPLAQCLLIRYVSDVIAVSQAPEGGNVRPFYEFLEGCLRHKAEMVIFEAARAITELNGVTTRELAPAITVLQLFLSSSKPVLRFAAVRILNRVAMTNPLAVTNCNIDMEGLISDQNRSIATLAITTLLKTGNEGSVDRLLKQIATFIGDIGDEFKVVVVDAIHSMCLKYPQKHRALMSFLSNILRDEGGFEYKKAIVDTILMLIREIPEAKESGLAHLCEFIEDCEFTSLSTQILHLLGREGPKSADPAKYIRYIYNRVILENATVRASAVCSLSRFGFECEELKDRVIILLERILYDNDDEVRDRATFFLAQLKGDVDFGANIAFGRLHCPLSSLESSLQAYLKGPEDSPFSLSAVPAAPVQPIAEPKTHGKPKVGTVQILQETEEEKAELYEAQLGTFPQFASLGKLFKSSAPFELTESETEYHIACVKHIFSSHIVFQFECSNTIEEQVLENVSVVMDLSETDGFEEEDSVPLVKLVCGAPGSTYVLVGAPGNRPLDCKIPCILKFTVKEIDPSTGEPEEDGFEDEYQLEDLDLTSADFVKKVHVPNFKNCWEELGEEVEIVDEYGLGIKNSLEETIETVTNVLGLQACEGSDCVPPNARSHTVLLSGKFVGDVKVLVRLSFGIDPTGSVAMRVAARGDTAEAAETVHSIISEA